MFNRSRTILAQFPWCFLLIGFLAVAFYTSTPLEGTLGYAFIALGVFVMFVEFIKSGDVSSVTFLVDHLFSIFAVIVCTALLSYLYFALGKVPNFFYWFGYAVVLGDAVISPFNAFRMALRNFGVSDQ
jgi:hypothetical protein